MKRSWIVAAMAIAITMLALPQVARAHEGHMHKALGTIASVQAAQLEIKTTDGKTLTVGIDKKTAITRGKEKLDATALIAGERVSVDYMEQNKTKTAHAIKLGATSTTAKK